MAAEPGRQLEAVQLGHSHVSDDKVGYFLVDELQGFDAVACLAHGVARPLQVATDHLLDDAVVIDEKDVRHHGHTCVSLETMARARSRRGEPPRPGGSPLPPPLIIAPPPAPHAPGGSP